jgi:hypothetical protein
MRAISRYHGEGGRGGLSEFHNGREEVLPDAITLTIELRDGQDSDWKKGATTDFFGVLNHASQIPGTHQPIQIFEFKIYGPLKI